jgi:hypothetical protein
LYEGALFSQKTKKCRSDVREFHDIVAAKTNPGGIVLQGSYITFEKRLETAQLVFAARKDFVTASSFPARKLA